MSSLPKDARLSQDARFWGPWADQVIPFGIIDDDDMPPTEPDFEPAPNDEREAIFLFGEHASYEEEDRFQVWIESLPPGRFQAVRDALDTLRNALKDFQADDRVSLEEWLDTLAPDDYETVSVIDCRGITD
jgi:hypothetical protein